MMTEPHTVKTWKDFTFYRKADSIMNGYSEAPFVNRLFHINYVQRFLCMLRLTELLKNNLHKYKILYLPYFFCSRRLDRLSCRCGFSIPLNTLSYGVYLPHHGTCVINAYTRVGSFCAIFNNVCIGDTPAKKIGKGVYLGTGVVVIKDANIADYVMISANSLVNKSISTKKTLWGGVPARLLKEDVQPWFMQWPWKDRVEKIEHLREKMYNIDIITNHK